MGGMGLVSALSHVLGFCLLIPTPSCSDEHPFCDEEPVFPYLMSNMMLLNMMLKWEFSWSLMSNKCRVQN